MTTTTSARAKRRPSDRSTTRRSSSRGVRWLLISGIIGAAAIAGLFAIFSSSSTDGSTGADSDYPYAVGNPGLGETAPPMRLPSTDREAFDLADLEGQRVMLYFQEGVMCQPCWDQLRDIEARWDEFDRLGIDAVVSITSDPLDVLEDKVALEGLDTPLLSDPGVEVSRTYEANEYGMMGNSMNGHSFVIVDPDGTIEWRADYGGAPNYTMYVPVDALLADMVEGLEGSTGGAS